MGENNTKKPVPLDYSPFSPPAVPRYRKILSGVLIVAGIFILLVGLFQQNASARINICVGGLFFLVSGLVIRFQQS